jgi:hypothetical protein
MEAVAEPAVADPAESNITVWLMPHLLTRETLETLAMASRPANRASDCLRAWLQRCVAAESARRIMPEGDWGDTPLEPPAWKIPWHCWDDNQLSSSLACSFAWTSMKLSEADRLAFNAIHEAVVVACATRLHELDCAIKASEARRTAGFAAS